MIANRIETRLLPTPRVAGWTEEGRELRAAKVRAEFVKAGGVVLSQDRIRNRAFDKRDERTTFKFVVEYRTETEEANRKAEVSRG